MKTRFKFLKITQRFQYKNTIFEKIGLGKAKAVYVSSLFKKDELRRTEKAHTCRQIQYCLFQ